MATYPQAQGFDLGSILQAAQLGKSLNPVNIQQEALNNQLALQLQQVQLQRAQQQLNDALNPNAAINRGLAADLVREAIVNGPRSGFYVTKPGVPVTQPLTPEEQSINEMRKTALEMGGVDLPQMTPKVIAEPVYGLGNEALPIARSLNARIKQAPFNLSQGEKRFDYNAETGKPELIAENAPKGVADKLITVNKGEKIINAAGQLIFENPSDSPKPTIVPSGGVVIDENGNEKFRNDKPTAPAKPLPKGISERISDAETSINNLITLKSYLDDPDVISRSGPLQGINPFGGGGNPFSATVGNFEGIRGMAKQNIGKYLEGGVLRAEDEKKYEKIIPGLKSLPAVQQNQSKELYKSLKSKLVTDLNSYERSGYDVTELRDGIEKLDAAFANTRRGTQPNIQTVTVTTKAQFDALPSGSQYIGKDGKTYQKP